MLVRRLLVLVAVLIVLTVLAGSIAPVPTPQEPAPQPEATAPRPPVRTVRASLSTSPRRAAQRIAARVGDEISITVRGAVVDTVALGDLDVEPVERGLPARFDLLADERGSYPLIALDAQRRIGTLVVR